MSRRLYECPCCATPFASDDEYIEWFIEDEVEVQVETECFDPDMYDYDSQPEQPQEVQRGDETILVRPGLRGNGSRNVTETVMVGDGGTSRIMRQGGGNALQPPGNAFPSRAGKRVPLDSKVQQANTADLKRHGITPKN